MDIFWINATLPFYSRYLTNCKTFWIAFYCVYTYIWCIRTSIAFSSVFSAGVYVCDRMQRPLIKRPLVEFSCLQRGSSLFVVAVRNIDFFTADKPRKNHRSHLIDIGAEALPSYTLCRRSLPLRSLLASIGDLGQCNGFVSDSSSVTQSKLASPYLGFSAFHVADDDMDWTSRCNWSSIILLYSPQSLRTAIKTGLKGLWV